jgi:Ca2+-transporting ATPase
LAACNDSRLDSRNGRASFVGDPTEAALLVAAAKANLRLEDIDARMPRLGSLPFTSNRKRMTTVRRRDGHPWAFVKGAPEVVIQQCSRIRTATGDEPLSAADRATMLEACAQMASDALRVLAFAQRRLESFSPSAIGSDGDTAIESELILLGLAGMQDPPRPEARDAIQRCKRAGIKTVMITGDHPETAGAIGRELGIVEHGGEVLIGRELQAMTDSELTERVTRVSVYARVTAEHKLRIVRAWKSRGAIVAMTGDGVNDAPALKEASVGVAMGRTGTEVTKQTADIIITDDNFASIVAAVEQGRGIYDNIVKTLAYLMGGNSGELAVMLLAALAGLPLPLVPIQLLWINLVTDGLPALALATDSIEPDVLARPPRDPKLEIMDRSFFGQLALIGTLSAGVTLAAFLWELHGSGTVATARNATFSVLVIEELMRSFSSRSGVRTIWEVGMLSNLRLLAVVAASFGFQIALLYLPLLQTIFGTVPATWPQIARWLILGIVPLGVLELRKLARRRRAASNRI